MNKPSSSEQQLSRALTLSQVAGLDAPNITSALALNNLTYIDLLNKPPSQLTALGLNQGQVTAIVAPDKTYIERCLTWLDSQPEHFILSPADADYPERLRTIAFPPFVLFGRGNSAALASLQLAIVGSRTPSVSGRDNALRFSRELAECGWTITSGLAMGVDACAHRGALEGKGLTIGVLGSGIDHITPQRSVSLGRTILEHGGCIVSEFAPGVPAYPSHFPRRNRIISGLSLGTLVVEAAIKSGSLITAYRALEQNREVFAIPGHINNVLSEGCHYLIKQGAKLVSCVEDINEEFQNLINLQDAQSEKNLQKSELNHLAYDLLLDSVDFEATTIDVIAHRSKTPVNEVLVALLEYELRGLVATVPGGYVKLRGK